MQDSRDMILTLVVMFLAVAVTIGFTGLCSFNPGKPENGPVREVDAAPFVNVEARRVDYPVRLPKVPEGWTSNSTRAGMAAGKQTTIIGYVTASGAFIQVTQTDAEAGQLPDDGKNRLRDGTTDVEGTTWTKYEPAEDNVRRVWVGDLGDSRAIIEGTANDEEFTQLAAALQKAEPIDPDRTMPDSSQPQQTASETPSAPAK
nr:DUF4245 domain-containing protein [Corynebacterium sp. LK29]